MKGILFAPLVFFLGAPLQAEISIQKVKASHQKAFVLCQLEQGLNKTKLEEEAKFILQKNGIPNHLFKDKEVRERAKMLFKTSGCKGFPKGIYMSDWVKSLIKESETIFNNASKEEQNLMKKISYAVCKYNNKDFSLLERDSYIKNISRELLVNLDPDNMKRLIEGSFGYSNNLDKRDCLTLKK